MNEVWNGDCLSLMDNIPDRSIDMVLCDLPYQVTSRNQWDVYIPLAPLWGQYKRIIKENGAIVLTAMQPFTSMLVMSNQEWFKYSWIWEKSQGTGFLNAKKQPLRNHEDILVFYGKQPTYNPQMTKGKPYTCKSGRGSLNYNEQVSVVTENKGERYPLTATLKYGYDKDKIHPTQKPVALFEYLIKTYTNEGELVLDNAAGSCTTAIAALNTNRRYLCIEKDEEFYNKGLKRIG